MAKTARFFVATVIALSGHGTLGGCQDPNAGPRPPGGDPEWNPTTGPGDPGSDSGDDGSTSGGSEGDTTQRLDTPPDTDGPGCNADLECASKVDLLFVIDNSGTMGEEQLNLARNFGYLVERLETLEVGGRPRPLDVNMMVTTSDFGNPACDAFREGGPEKGAPVDTPCTDRLDRFRFEALDPPLFKEDVCTQACTTGAHPQDAFINFHTGTDATNVVGGDAAEALTCIGPQGVDGCGYEAPLESMLQALNEGACWNRPDPTGCEMYDRPFLRPDALLAIVIVTDEADCSVKDYGIMNDGTWFEPNPNGTPRATSAVCWNAGVECDPPDGSGSYPNCRSRTDDLLQPTSRYIDYLVGHLRDNRSKEVVMLGILGVPPVTAHADTPPFQPTAGGVFDLEYRDWRDGIHPDGDILPDDAAAGMDASSKQHEFGIGPGCTGEDPMGGFTGQAIPPVRIKEVCEGLNFTDGDGDEQVRCCIESICDTDFSAAINCLTGIIADVIPPPG